MLDLIIITSWLIPLSLSTIFYLALIKLSTGIAFRLSLIVAPLLFGISFIFLQIFHWLFIFGSSGLDNTFEFLFVEGLPASWWLVNNFFPAVDLGTDFMFIHWWIPEIIYFLFYGVLGVFTTLGIRLWKNKIANKIIGIFVLVVVFVIYTYGYCFWMLAQVRM